MNDLQMILALVHITMKISQKLFRYPRKDALSKSQCQGVSQNKITKQQDFLLPSCQESSQYSPWD